MEARTEIEFFDSECSVLSNLPLPKQNEVYYWESKIYDKPESTLISIGVATKPYPLFRLPGIFTLHHIILCFRIDNSVRVAQVLSSLCVDRKPKIQSTIQRTIIRTSVCRRRRHRSRVSTTNWNDIFHTKWQEAGRCGTWAEVTEPFPSSRCQWTMYHPCQLRSIWLCFYRGECKEMGTCTNDWEFGTTPTIR